LQAVPQFMPTIVNLPQQSFANGVLTIPQVAVPAGITSATVSIGRATAATPTLWPSAATTLSFALECSYDGGATWIPGGGFTAQGGIAQKGGVDVPATEATFGYSRQPTHVRGSATIAGGPLVTTVTVTVQ
jgi:hypothetical protein